MDHYLLYHREIPSFLQECLQMPPLQRLQNIGMNCGCEYSSFPRFLALQPYSRYDHSIGVALIVWHFTHSPAQALAGLLHDVATPVFAHVVDFMRGDYLKQEATEAGTEAIIASSPELQKLLQRYGLATEDVCDYHRYPIADNDSPRLSADRLEYTLGNSINYGICTEQEILRFYENLLVCKNEEGQDELTFADESIAASFAFAALQCSKIYVSEEDRYMMQMLSELLKTAIARHVIRESDLYSTEPEVLAHLTSDGQISVLWQRCCSFRRILTAEKPGPEDGWRKVAAKKRCIDPLVRNRGRVSSLSPEFAEALNRFLNQSQDCWLLGQA